MENKDDDDDDDDVFFSYAVVTLWFGKNIHPSFRHILSAGSIP